MHLKHLTLSVCVAMGCAQMSYAQTTTAPTAQKAAAVKTVAKLGFSEAPFGALPTGEATTLYTLTNANGLVVKATNFGGVITSISTPDKNGKMGDIVLGFDNVEGYLKNKSAS